MAEDEWTVQIRQRLSIKRKYRARVHFNVLRHLNE